MESNGLGWVDQAESVLDQLLKFTAQLAELENDPEVDAKAISDACIMRLEELKQLVPRDLKRSSDSANEILAKMRDLYARTQECLNMLERKNNHVTEKIRNLSRTKHAIAAYNVRGGHKR
jgi:hypothetical protein